MGFADSEDRQVESFHFRRCLTSPPCLPHCPSVPIKVVALGIRRGIDPVTFEESRFSSQGVIIFLPIPEVESKWSVCLLRIVFFSKVVFYGMELLIPHSTLPLYPGLGPAVVLEGLATEFI